MKVDGDETSLAVKILLNELTDSGERSKEQSELRDMVKGGDEGRSDESQTGIEGIHTPREPIEDRQFRAKSEEQQNREELFFVRHQDITINTTFRPDKKEEDEKLPVHGSGSIDNLLAIAQADTFSVYVEVDNTKVINNESISDLKDISDELANISAYQTGSGKQIINVSDYPFNDSIDWSITPTESTTFDEIRTEIILDRYSR